MSAVGELAPAVGAGAADVDAAGVDGEAVAGAKAPVGTPCCGTSVGDGADAPFGAGTLDGAAVADGAGTLDGAADGAVADGAVADGAVADGAVAGGGALLAGKGALLAGGATGAEGAAELAAVGCASAGPHTDVTASATPNRPNMTRADSCDMDFLEATKLNFGAPYPIRRANGNLQPIAKLAGQKRKTYRFHGPRVDVSRDAEATGNQTIGAAKQRTRWCALLSGSRRSARACVRSANERPRASVHP